MNGDGLLILGTVLFLLGLLTGLALPVFRNKRMGLSAHLVGVQHGMVLWALGLIVPKLAPATPALHATMLWSLVLGLYGLWLAMLLAAIWGASQALPMAGAGHSASRGREGIVAGLVYLPATGIVLGTVLLLGRQLGF
jgi:hydroxylaminobenzene mutase